MSGSTVIPVNNGMATLTQEQLADLTITPPPDSNVDMDLKVTATATQGGSTAQTTEHDLHVDVIGVADAPNLATEDSTGDENQGIPLDISTNLTDTDGSESLSITIGNIPDGATLNKGTLNADGTYTLTPAQLFGLEVTPATDFEGTFTLFVTSTSTENDGDQANTFDVLNVNVEGGADTPVLIIGDSSGLEDSAIALNIDAQLTDLSETLSVTISGVPDGAALSNGTIIDTDPVTGETTWNVMPAHLNTLSITPPEDSNVDFNLTVTAASTNGNGDIAETEGTVYVAVQSVADEPELETENATGTGGEAIDLEITSALTDLDGSESLSLTISGVPQGASLSAGVYTGNGTWALEPGDLNGLTISTPENYDTDFDLTVTATATDSEPVGEVPYTDTASVTATIHVDMEDAQADPPVLVVDDAEGLEDNAIPLDITASLTDPEETLSMTISGVPQGASLSLGTDQGEGVWSFTEADLANIENLTITPPLHSDVDFDLTVTATSQDGDDTATVSDTLTVVVGAVADTPAVSADDGSGDVGQTIPLDISSALVNQDGSESLSITISDVPAGASLSAGTDNQDETWTLELADLTGLNINLPADASDDFDLTVTATATEADGGDTASNVVTSVINVGPNANDDVNEADMGGFTSGNVITGLGDIVDPNAAADTGSTTGNTITEVTFGDTTVSFSDPSAVQTDENGNFVTIEGDFGTLKMYEDGDYGYVADPSQAGESGSVGLTDPASPDEVEAAWSGIETFAFDFGTSYLDNNGQLDPNLADDTVSFNQNGIGVEGTQGGMPVPGQINHDENTGQSEALGVNLGMMAATATVQVSNMYQSEDGGEQGVWQAFDADGNLVGEGVLDDTTVDFGSSSNVGTAEISLPDGAQFQYLVFTATDTGGDTNPNDSSDFYIRSIEFETPGVVEGEDLFGYTMADADGDTASATLTINVENNDVTAEPPVLVVDDVQGLEDTAIALDISAALTDTDGSETLSVTISDVPDGVTLSAGTLNPDGSYTLTPDQLDGLTVTPPLHSNVDFDLTISATSVESASGDTNTVTETMTVDVVGVADEPPLTAELGDGSYEPGDPQVLTVEVTNVGNASAGYNNTYGYYIKGENGEPVEGGIVWSNVKTTVGDSETITLEGVDPASVGFFLIPDGYDHNPGMTDGMPVTFQQDDAGIWTPVAPDGTLMAGQGAPAFFSDEALNPDDYDHMVDNDVIGNQNWEDLFGGGDNDYNDANFNATMETSGGTPGNTTFPLDIATSLVDADGSETLSVTVAGLPEGVTLSAGTDNGNGSYTLTTDQLDDLSMNVPEGVDGGFDFSVTSTTTEDDGDTASVSTTLNVPEIDLVAETPELVVENVTGDEDTAIALDISAALTDTDGSETLSVTISDVPDGVTLSAGTLNDDGSYTLLPEQLDGLTATPPADSNVDFDLTISATSIEQSSGDTNTVTQTMTVDVIGVADEPTLDVALGDPTTSGGNPQPVAYWNMNESSDQGTLADSVGGHTAETHCGLDMDDAGVFGTTAAEFNGSNDYISVPHSDDIKPDSGAITVWFNADTVSGRGTLVSSDSSGFDTGGHFGLFVENGHLRLRMQGTDDQTNITGGDVSTGEWNQVTVTWGDDGAQVYLNGEQVASDSSWTRGLEGNDNPWTFGTNQWVSGDDVANNLRDYFNGHMDDIAIFDTQLSADDVSSLYSAGVTEIMAGGEGGDLVYPLDITSNLTDTDGSETLSLTVNGLPEGATLSAGTVNDDGSVTLSPDELQGLELTVPGGSTDGFDLTVSSTATENDGDTATVSQTVTAGALDGTAETPELDVDNAIGAEDTAIALNIDAALTDTDGSETLSVTISGVPTGAQLSAGTDNQDGTWTLESGDLNGLTITPPANSNEDIALSVTATSTESSTGDTATATANLTVDVIGVADQPQVVVQDEQGNEDTWIQLHLDSGPSVDTDGSETLSITISDVPQGARLNPDADNGDGTWTVTAAQLPLVCILPPDDFSGDITMTLNVTTTENDGDTTTVSDDFTVSVIGVADGPSVTATQAQGYEDSAIALNIGASLTDDDNSETLSVTISGIPQGATLSAGTVNNDGSVTLTPQQLDGLTITPPEHSNEDFPLTVSATSTETATGDTATTTATFNVGVTGVADTPSLSVTVGQPTLESGGAGSEFIVNGSFESVANQLDSDDADNFATLEGWQTTDESFEIHGVDYNYRDASSQSDGDFKLELDGGKDDYGNDTGLGSNSNIFQDVQGLAEGATYTLSFDSDNREGDADGYFEVFWGGEKIATITDNTAGFISHEFELVGGAGDGSDRLEFNLIGENEWAVYLDNVSLEGTENTLTYPLDIASGLVDTDGSETLSVTVSGLPDGASLSAGTVNDDGSVTLSAAELQGLSVRVPESQADGFNLSVSSTATENDGDTATVTQTVTIDAYDGGAEAPELEVENATGLEDTVFALNIDAALADTDGSETLSVTIGGVPDGASLSAGTDNQDGTWTLTSEQLEGLTLTPPADCNEDFSLMVTATSSQGTDTASTVAELMVDITGVADAPTLSAEATYSQTTGGETTIDVPQTVLDAATGDNVVTVSGVPDGASLSAGTDNQDGTWTVSAGDVDGLTITPADGSTDTVSLTFDVTGGGSSGDVLFSDNFDNGVSGWGDDAGEWYGAMEIERDETATRTFDFGPEHAGQTVTLSFDSQTWGSWDTSGGSRDYFIVTTNGSEVINTSDRGSDSHSVTVTLDQNGQLQLNMTADATGSDEGVDIDNFVITAGDDYSSTLATASVDVEPDATGHVYDLDITSALTDTDGSETLSITVGNLPNGASLSAGTQNQDGTWTLGAGDLDGLTVTVADDTADFNLAVSATATENDGDTNTVSTAVAITAPDLGAEAPELTVYDAAGDEDTVFALNIDAALTDTDGSETLSVTISGVPNGASLSAGTDNQDGTWTLTQDQLTDLTLTPPADSNEDFSLMVTATSSQGTDTASTVAELMVDITGVADTPTLSIAVGDPTVLAGNPQPIAYWTMDETSDQGTIADSVGGHTGETHCGLDMDDGGVFNTTSAEFKGSNDYISVPHSDDLKPDSGAITLWFNADTVSGRQALVSSDSSGYDTGGHFGLFVENGCLRLRMQGTDSQIDMTDGSVSSHSWNQVTVTWGEAGAQVYMNGEHVMSDANWTRGLEGNDNPWTFGTNQWVSGNDVANNLRDYFNGHMDDIAMFDQQLTADQIGDLYSTGVNQFMNSGDGGDLVYPIEIAGALTDTDGSETLSISVDGLPDGATLSAGTVNDDGSWSLGADDLDGLTMTVESEVTDPFNMTVTTTATEDDGDVATNSAVVEIDPGAAGVTMTGDEADDSLTGTGGDDTVSGGEGDDELFGDDGMDVLYGGAGADELQGGAGDDVLLGGEGGDTFIFDAESGDDVITDIFANDTLVFEGQEFHMDDLILSENEDGDVVMSFNNVEGASVTLSGVKMEDLDTNDDGSPSDGYSVTEDDGKVTITLDGIT